MRELKFTACLLVGCLLVCGAVPNSTCPALEPVQDVGRDDVRRLADELREKGWLVFSARTDHGDWDLVVMRPDGSDRRKLTDTREYNEVGARFSPDGRRLLFYRMPATESVDNNNYGTFDLVIAEADGSGFVLYGDSFPWASWSPDGKQVACLRRQGIVIVDLASRRVVREVPRKGIVSQLIWSPDGKRFIGTTNGLGPYWNIGCLNPENGDLQAVSETDRYNCTPDWTPDARHVVYARGIIPEVGGRAELWVAGTDSQDRRALYAEGGRHIYGACVSPDGQYLLFTRSVADLGRVNQSGTTLAIVRWRDTPMRGDQDATLRRRLPDASTGPRLDLGPGWEPHWTRADLSCSIR